MIKPKKAPIVVYIPGFLITLGLLIFSLNNMIKSFDTDETWRVIVTTICFLIFLWLTWIYAVSIVVMIIMTLIKSQKKNYENH